MTCFTRNKIFLFCTHIFILTIPSLLLNKKCLSPVVINLLFRRYIIKLFNKFLKVLLVEDVEPMIVHLAKTKLCHCYLHDEQFSLSLQYCEEALNIQRTPDIHCDKAEVYIATEMYDDGTKYCLISLFSI